MIKYFILLCPTIFFALSCTNSTTTKNDTPADTLKQKQIAPNDTTPRVTGIGGIFFRCKNPKSTREWYGKNLGLSINEYGSTFEYRNANRPDEINYLEWSPFNEKTKYFSPSEKEFMINYRVNNLTGLVRNLKQKGITIVDTIQTVDYWRFRTN